MSANPTRKDIIHAILTNPKLSEEEKSALVEEFMEEIKKEYPDLKYHATKQDITETELKLIKEIKEVESKLKTEIKEIESGLRKEIKELDIKLSKEIKEVEARLKTEIKEIEAGLKKEIKELDVKINQVELRLTKEIKEAKTAMIKWSFLFWISQVSVILGMGFMILKVIGKF